LNWEEEIGNFEEELGEWNTPISRCVPGEDEIESDTIEQMREVAKEYGWHGLLDLEGLGILNILSHFIDRNVYNGTNNVWVDDVDVSCIDEPLPDGYVEVSGIVSAPTSGTAGSSTLTLTGIVEPPEANKTITSWEVVSFVETGCIKVTDITGLPSIGIVDTPLTLTGNIIPNDADNKTITSWEIVEQE